jgi:hypothetical protein
MHQKLGIKINYFIILFCCLFNLHSSGLDEEEEHAWTKPQVKIMLNEYNAMERRMKFIISLINVANP